MSRRQVGCRKLVSYLRKMSFYPIEGELVKVIITSRRELHRRRLAITDRVETDKGIGAGAKAERSARVQSGYFSFEKWHY